MFQSRINSGVSPRATTMFFSVPLSMGFLRKEYSSGLPFLPPGDLPDPGFEPALAGRFLYH